MLEVSQVFIALRIGFKAEFSVQKEFFKNQVNGISAIALVL